MTTKIILAAFLVGLLVFSSFIESGQKSSFSLDPDTSVVEWKGAGKNVEHSGSFAIFSKNLKVEKGKLKEGTFIIPIASIKNFDLPEEVKPVLLNHLKSADFFNLALHPEAKFKITSVERLDESQNEVVAGVNHLIKGEFTMLGKTNPISFPARIEVKGDQFTAEADLQIDRTKWGMEYGADPSLGDHHIFPIVDIHLKLFGNKTLL